MPQLWVLPFLLQGPSLFELFKLLQGGFWFEPEPWVPQTALVPQVCGDTTVTIPPAAVCCSVCLLPGHS